MDTKDLKIAAFMTAPRYGAIWSLNMIWSALSANGIPLNVSGGVFYGQCMQNMLERAIRNGVEFAVTVDFDSVITPSDVKRIIASAQDSKIDAVAALQARRGRNYPLFTSGEATAVETDGTPLQVTTAHFGLTVIKLDRLKDIPKPWFHSKPDETGSWGDGKIDEDVWFWKQWNDNGRTVYVDTGCAIGHYEEVVSMVNPDSEIGEHTFHYPNDWLIQFKPTSSPELAK